MCRQQLPSQLQMRQSQVPQSQGKRPRDDSPDPEELQAAAEVEMMSRGRSYGPAQKSRLSQVPDAPSGLAGLSYNARVLGQDWLAAACQTVQAHTSPTQLLKGCS